MFFPVKKQWTGIGYQIVITFDDYYSGTNESGDKVALTIPCTDYRWVDVEKKQVNIQEVVEELSKSKSDNGGVGSTPVHSIQVEREDDYGDASESMNSIGEFWGTYISRKQGFSIKLDNIDVAHMMELFKINRNAYKRKEDNLIDSESYANFATRFFKEQ